MKRIAEPDFPPSSRSPSIARRNRGHHFPRRCCADLISSGTRSSRASTAVTSAPNSSAIRANTHGPAPRSTTFRLRTSTSRSSNHRKHPVLNCPSPLHREMSRPIVSFFIILHTPAFPRDSHRTPLIFQPDPAPRFLSPGTRRPDHASNRRSRHPNTPSPVSRPEHSTCLNLPHPHIPHLPRPSCQTLHRSTPPPDPHAPATNWPSTILQGGPGSSRPDCLQGNIAPDRQIPP